VAIKKKKKKKETAGQNIMACPISQGGHNYSAFEDISDGELVGIAIAIHRYYIN